MNTETEYLKSIAKEIAAQPNPDHDRPNFYLAIEARRLEKAILTQFATNGNCLNNEAFPLIALTEIVNICDILYDSSGMITNDVRVILELLEAVRLTAGTGTRSNIKLPRAFLITQRASIHESCELQQERMREHAVDENLIIISAIPFKRFTEPAETLFWQDFTWLRAYEAKLKIMDWEQADCGSAEEALLSLLIGRDFNDDRFYIYCKKYIRSRTDKFLGKRRKLLEFLECQRLILQDTQAGVPSFDLHANPISQRLLKWIEEEMTFIERHEKETPQLKFEFRWNVETLAFFFKLLWDHKVFGKVSLEPFSEQIASNCSSVGRDEFQASTIYSRFYVKDPEVILTIEKILDAMLKDVRQFL